VAVIEPQVRPPLRARRLPRRVRARRRLAGAIGMLVVAALAGGVVLAYQQVFTPTVPATVIAPRAGLLMYPGADVTLYGVTIGRVTSIVPAGGQARLDIALDPAQVSHIPANVQASIAEPTVFGPKFLDLVVPPHPVARRLQPGQVIEPAAAPTEVNTVFESLVTLLDSVHPAKLAATLGAISTALHGRGAELGGFIAQLNSYLREFNPSLPAVATDLAIAPPVLRTYAAAAPALVRTLASLRVTSGTLVGQQAQFDAFLLDLTGFSGNARSFLAGNERGLTATLATLAPTTALLARYSPEFGCLFASVAQFNRLSVSDKIILHSTILPGQQGYQYPANLPVMHATSGPSCYGGPITPAEAAHYPHIVFNDGTAGFFSRNDSLTPGNPPLAVQLFGTQIPPAAKTPAAGSPAGGNSAAGNSAAGSPAPANGGR
jgi:phospholipid/cholesterol/gamma-HCH transport system substrate-binding protein